MLAAYDQTATQYYEAPSPPVFGRQAVRAETRAPCLFERKVAGLKCSQVSAPKPLERSAWRYQNRKASNTYRCPAVTCSASCNSDDENTMAVPLSGR